MHAGLRISGDQRQITSATLPVHLADVLPVADGVHGFSDSSGNNQLLFVRTWVFLIIMYWEVNQCFWGDSKLFLTGMYMKNTPPVSSNSINSQGPLLQVESLIFFLKSLILNSLHIYVYLLVCMKLFVHMYVFFGPVGWMSHSACLLSPNCFHLVKISWLFEGGLSEMV